MTAGEPSSSKVPAHQALVLVHYRTTAHRLKALQSHSLRPNLALTFYKLVLKPKDIINELLYGLEMFLGVCGMSINSSNLQMAGGCHIYRPPSLVAVALTVSRILRAIG